jgi:hypothetical protein
MPYILHRTLPDGTARRHETPFTSMRGLIFAAAYVLIDNAMVKPADARRFALELSRHPLNADVLHEGSGYRFRIEEI